jgi:Putative transmembrane protein (Alph_Pro_TM)
MVRIPRIGLLCVFTFTLFRIASWAEAQEHALSMDGSERQDVSPASQEGPGPDFPHSDLLLVPNTVPIGLFFHDGKVSARGILPPGCDAALIVQSQNQAMDMNIRGKRLGLWMTVGTARFEDAPAFYQCLTSKPIRLIASRETATENGLSLEKIKREMKLHLKAEKAVRNAGQDARAWKDEFVEFKEGRGLFSVKEGALRVTNSPGGAETVQGEIVLPASSPEGDYRVVLVAFRDGSPVARVEGTFSVTMMPTVAFLRDLAMEHGWLYGIVAVLAALLAGFGVAAIVPSRSGGH